MAVAAMLSDQARTCRSCACAALGQTMCHVRPAGMANWLAAFPGVAAPAYSSPGRAAPRPCANGNRPNSNTYIVQMRSRANWQYGANLMIRATTNVYALPKYNFRLAITVTAGRRQTRRQRGQTFNVWT